MRLQGKVAIVTGGTSGIGRGMVERFAQEGATVFFTGRREALGAEVAKKTGATYIKADVTSEADTARTVAVAAKVKGRVDVLVNNANIPTAGARLETQPLEMFDIAMAYVRGAYAHIKHVSPLMRAQRQGSIINIGSASGHRGGLVPTTYSVAKAAVIHLTRCAAMELGEDNVRVNSLSPGAIVTGIFGKAFGLAPDVADATEEKVADALSKAQSIPRAGRAEDVVNAAVYLASDEASFLNGSDIVVDGGMIWGQRFSQMAAGFQAMATMFQ